LLKAPVHGKTASVEQASRENTGFNAFGSRMMSSSIKEDDVTPGDELAMSGLNGWRVRRGSPETGQEHSSPVRPEGHIRTAIAHAKPSELVTRTNEAPGPVGVPANAPVAELKVKLWFERNSGDVTATDPAVTSGPLIDASQPTVRIQLPYR